MNYVYNVPSIGSLDSYIYAEGQPIQLTGMKTMEDMTNILTISTIKNGFAVDVEIPYNYTLDGYYYTLDGYYKANGEVCSCEEKATREAASKAMRDLRDKMNGMYAFTTFGDLVKWLGDNAKSFQ